MPNTQAININLSTLETVTCPICQSPVFEMNLIMFKRLPAIQSPTGRAQLVKVDFVNCPACNNLFQIKDGVLLPVETITKGK